MTKFIDKSSPVKATKATVFTKFVDMDLEICAASSEPYDYENVEFIGHDNRYGDVFKTWDNYPNNFTLYFGTKGEEQYVNE